MDGNEKQTAKAEGRREFLAAAAAIPAVALLVSASAKKAYAQYGIQDADSTFPAVNP